MKLYQLLHKVDRNDAVKVFTEGWHVLVANDYCNYYVDSYSIFDKEDVSFYILDYKRLDIIKLIEHLREHNDSLDNVSTQLYSGETFTSLLPTSLI